MDLPLGDGYMGGVGYTQGSSHHSLTQFAKCVGMV